MTEKKYPKWFPLIAVIFVLGSFLINMKNIFISCHVDAEYQIAMAYRILKGDKMFSQMWEAHQTSAFLLAFFEWFFLKITGSAMGIMIYANVMGILCKTVTAFCVYGTLRKFTDKIIAFAALIFVLNTYPKDVVLPDFANMQIWFGLLCMCGFIWYFETRKIKWLISGAVCLCLEVLSYPSCVLVFIGCTVLLLKYSPKKKRDICIFTGVCAAGAFLYLLYFMRGDPEKFLRDIYYIWSGDESHAVGLGQRLVLLGQDALLLISDLKYIAPTIICAAAAAWIVRTVRRSKNTAWSKRNTFFVFLCCFLFFYVLGYLIHLPAEKIQTKYHFFILYLCLEIFGWIAIRYLNPKEKRIFVTGQLIGLGGFIATMLLSDMGVFTSIPYLIPGMCVCLLPLGKVYPQKTGERVKWNKYAAVIIFCMVMIFRNFIYKNGWMAVPANFYEDSIFGMTGVSRFGPLKGIINGNGTFLMDGAYVEWLRMIQEGDRVLVLSYPTLNATAYLYNNVEICVDSTISTPTYSERLFTYWKENPDKYPNVIVIKNPDQLYWLGEDNEIIRWLEHDLHIKEIVDGYYGRYIFLEE